MSLKRNLPGKRFKGAIKLHDNVNLDTANLTKDIRYDPDVLPHLTLSPDLTPPGYHPFGFLERNVSGKWFYTDNTLVGEAEG